MKNLTTLFLVRHGQTEWNLENRIQGQLNSPLTPLGINQSINMQQKLLPKNIDIAYSSPLLRAVETTALIIAKWNIKMITRYNLSEMQLGPWQGKTYEEIQKTYPQEYINFCNKPDQYCLTGAESYADFQQRVIAEIKSIFYNNIGKNILVVSHGIAIKVFLAYVLQINLTEIVKFATLDNGTCLTLKYESEQIELA